MPRRVTIDINRNKPLLDAVKLGSLSYRGEGKTLGHPAGWPCCSHFDEVESPVPARLPELFGKIIDGYLSKAKARN